MNKKKYQGGNIEINLACYIFGISMALCQNITSEFIYDDYHEYIRAINL